MWLSDKSLIKRVLIVSLTNVGDVLASCPVIDVCLRDFPQAQLDVVVGPSAVSLFEGHPLLTAIAFDKRATLQAKVLWFMALRRRNYDLVIDLRNTLLPYFLLPRYKTAFPWGNQHGVHMTQKHLNRLRSVWVYDQTPAERKAIVPLIADQQLFEIKIGPFVGGKPFILIAPGAMDAGKRWHPEGFAQVADKLVGQFKVIVVATAHEVGILDAIKQHMTQEALFLAGALNLRQLAFIIQKSALVLAHDSGVMHMASYFNVPVVGLYGPTDPQGSAPWSSKAAVVRRNQGCLRCQHPDRRGVPHTCMASIQASDVLEAIQSL